MTLFDELKILLAQDQRLTTNGELLKNQIIEYAFKLDKDLLLSLLSNGHLKANFFVEVEDILVFDKEKFIRFVNNKAFLPNSYTTFKNKIGLTVGERYLKENQDVVLSWPYKDCILEGDQTNKDTKRNEIFWNEILAPDEIDRLLSPKVFTNWRRYGIGIENTDIWGENDNLIIKGNNLLALHSLVKRFPRKVKLIYIDPPYNTGNDEFKYNDSFNHSTWITFMKNRLEVAKELLSNDGFILVQCDDNENAYLKVLMDEIFDKENYRNSIYWHRTYAGKTVSKNLPWNVDTILLYSKTQATKLIPITSELTEKDIASFNKDDNDERGPYATVSLQKTGGPGPETTYDYVDNSGNVWKCPKKGWRMIKEKLRVLENDNRLYITSKTIREKYYLNERLEIGKQIDNFWGDIGNMNRSSDADYDLAGQKPEKLIERIIEMGTSKGDLVLDFFLGTGTTAAVAHKLGRQYIGIEQLDYGDNDSIRRLQNVINGDPTGISEKVNWKGGGSFVACDLMQWNDRFVQKILEVQDTSKLQALWLELQTNANLSYRLDLHKFTQDAYTFSDLSLENQKRFLLETLDKNALYVNFSEIDDETYGVSEQDKCYNRKFYGK